MNRRKFLQTLTTGTVGLISSHALAQTPADLFQVTQQQVADAMSHATELTRILDKDIAWIDGFSDGQSCTFDNPHLTFYAHTFGSSF